MTEDDALFDAWIEDVYRCAVEEVERFWLLAVDTRIRFYLSDVVGEVERHLSTDYMDGWELKNLATCMVDGAYAALLADDEGGAAR